MAFTILTLSVFSALANPVWVSRSENAQRLIGGNDWASLNASTRFGIWRTAFGHATLAPGRASSAFAAFRSNDALIDAHNANPGSYWLGHNEFSDLTQEEFSERMLGLIPQSSRKQSFNISTSTLQVTENTPASIDWVARGAVTAVKNQEQCGSCWSFSATGAIEGAYFISSGKLMSLSEQQLVSCDKQASACSGGNMDQAFAWVNSNGGLCTEDAYPYVSGAKNVPSCNNRCQNSVTVAGHVDVPQSDENSLLAAVAQQPVSVAVDAMGVFQLYSHGVLTSNQCGSQLDHGVLAVGYGTDNGLKYWKVKNSWGATWGEQGFIRLQRGVNMCGIANMASYPTGARRVGPAPTPAPTPTPPGHSKYTCAFQPPSQFTCRQAASGTLSQQECASQCHARPTPTPTPPTPTPTPTRAKYTCEFKLPNYSCREAASGSLTLQECQSQCPRPAPTPTPPTPTPTPTPSGQMWACINGLCLKQQGGAYPSKNRCTASCSPIPASCLNALQQHCPKPFSSSKACLQCTRGSSTSNPVCTPAQRHVYCD